MNGVRAASIGAVLGAAAWFASWIASSRFHDSSTPPRASSAAVDLSIPAAAESAPTRDEEPEFAATRATEVPSLPRAGRIRFEVVDASARAPLRDARTLFLQERRFAECAADGAFDATLTAGHWSLLVVARGYEAEALAPVDLEERETIDLGLVALERGSGIIEGRVAACHLRVDEPVVVALFGEGCPAREHRAARLAGDVGSGRNAEDVEDDGDEADPNHVTVLGDRHFRFERLAAGTYWLRAFDPAARIVSMSRIEMTRGGFAWRDLEIDAPTTARFELRHEDGRRFTGAWTAFHEDRPAPIVYEFRRDDQLVATVETTPSYEETLESAGAPLAKSRSKPTSGGNCSGTRALDVTQLIREQGDAPRRTARVGGTDAAPPRAASSEDGEPARLDRARLPTDRLAFDAGEPACESPLARVHALRDDFHEITPLPRGRLTVVVSSCAYRSDEIALDLRDGTVTSTEVVLRFRQEAADLQAAIRGLAVESCSNCHGGTNPGSR